MAEAAPLAVTDAVLDGESVGLRCTGGALVALGPDVGPEAGDETNRERLNCLLMLMQLQINEQADLDSYIRSIRDWLMSRDGQPKPRRLIADPFRHELAALSECAEVSEGARREPWVAGSPSPRVSTCRSKRVGGACSSSSLADACPERGR